MNPTIRENLRRARTQNDEVLERREQQHGRDLLHTFKMMQHVNECPKDNFEISRAKDHIDHQFAKLEINAKGKTEVKIPTRFRESYKTIHKFNAYKYR